MQVQLSSGVLYVVLASGIAAKAGGGVGDTVDEAEELVLDLSSQVGHVFRVRSIDYWSFLLAYSSRIEF